MRLQRSSKQPREQAAFNLTKWSSNSPEVMQAIPEKDGVSDSLIRLESDLPGMHPFTKALGLKWNTRTDSLVFMIELDSLKLKSETLYTKRELASLAAKIFDPIGLISPFTVRSKLLLQSLWTQGVGWDDELPEETSRKWVQWVQELPKLEQLHIPRSYIDWPLSQHAKVELHAFGDASEVAYATAIYIRIVPKEGKASTSVVMSNIRVSLLRKITLPR